MSKKILYKQENGKIAIITPAEGADIDQVLSSIPVQTMKTVVEENQLPNDDDLFHFFEGLTVDFNTNAIGFDIDECRKITEQRLRRERVSLFEKNDLALRDAMLENDTDAVNRAIAERDRLRDITLVPDTIDTLDGLRNLHP
jgi:hypothetical protein